MSQRSSIRTVIIVVVSIALLTIIYFSIDFWKNRPRIIHCDDGVRQTIDYKDLQINYSGDKILLEIEAVDKFKLRPEIYSRLLQRTYESSQNWDQFLKAMVVRYNSCAISKADYTAILQKYKLMEEISKNLSQLILKSPSWTVGDGRAAIRLMYQYVTIGQELFTQSVIR